MYIRGQPYNFCFFSRSNVAKFPSITICPDYSVAYKEDVLRSYGVTAGDIRNQDFPNFTEMTSLEFYNLVTYDLNELLKDLFIKVFSVMPGTRYSSFLITEQSATNHSTESLFGNIMRLDLSQNWKVIYYRTFGRCYTYTMPAWIKSLRVRIF